MTFITKRERSDNYYQHLQQQTLQRLQTLSGEVWTDYNVHDPGVTIADFMNYALFELKYKLELPFEAYLGPDQAAYPEKGIFSAEELFSPSIVTTDDYEHFILGQIAELESCQVKFKDGFYTINVSFSDKSVFSDQDIKDKVYRLYHAHRNLAEDLRYEDVNIIEKSAGRKKKIQTTVLQASNPKEPEKQPLTVHNYRSFQYDFPENYGIGPRGLPGDATAPRRAQALQLKGYLLLADYMLADATNQVRDTSQFIGFSTIPDGKIAPVNIPDARKVVDMQKFGEENELRSAESIHARKAGYLDMLDTLYGENTAKFFSEFRPGSHPNDYRSALISNLPHLNRDRFLSFNKLNENGGPAVINELVSLLYGREENSDIPLHELMGRYGLNLISDSNFFDQYDVYLNLSPISGVFYTPIFNEEPREVNFQAVTWKDSYYEMLREQISLLRRNALFESFLLYGAMPQYYKQIRLTENDRYLLVFRYPGKEEWLVIGDFRTEEELSRAASKFRAFIRLLDPDRKLFYVVEHRLLEEALTGGDSKADGNMISVVAGGNSGNDASRKQLDKLLDERLPAHLQINVYHVKPDYLYDFARLYNKWRQTLAHGEAAEKTRMSESIRAFFRVSTGFLTNIR